MKKSLALLAGASLLFLGLPCVSHAQAASGPFADVPADHWAYQSVDTLQKAGIVIGYPDGTYGGKRPMTRYEFAVAIARLVGQMNPGNMATKSDLDALRSDLEQKLAANSDAIEALRKLVNGFQDELTRMGQDIAAINKRLDNLEARVAAVEEEQRRVKFTGDLNLIARADVATHRQGPYIGAPAGVPNDVPYAPIIDQNGVAQGGTAFIDGGVIPGQVRAPGSSKRLLEHADVYHDFLLGIRGKISDTATAVAKIDFGNYLSSVGNIDAFNGYTAGGGTPGLSGNRTTGSLGAGNQFTTVYEAYLDAPVSLGPLGGAELLAGRFGTQFTKYTFMLPDADVYTYLYQTDSGNIPVDGAQLNLKFGPVGVQAFAGKFTAIPFAQPYGGSTGILGTPSGIAGVGPQAGGRPAGEIFANKAAAFKQGAGVRAVFGRPESLVVGVTAEQFAIGNTLNGLNGPLGVAPTDPERITLTTNPAGGAPIPNATPYNRVSVYGADVNGALPFMRNLGLTLDAAYNVSAHGANSGFNNIGNGNRYASHEEQLGIKLGGLSIKGGYQYVGPYFSAPGYWGRLGSWTNPTNIKGPVLSAKYAFSPKLTLNADAEWYKAAYGSTKNLDPVTGKPGFVNSPLQQNDHVNRYQVGLGYGLSSTYAVDLGYESVTYDLRGNGPTGVDPFAAPGVTGTGLIGPGHPTETYITLGVGHSFNPNMSFKLLYQIVSYKDKSTGFGGVGATALVPHPDNDSYGGIAVGQFSLKF